MGKNLKALFFHLPYSSDFGEAPPLGLGYLAAEIRKHGYDAKIADLCNMDFSPISNYIYKLLSEEKPSLVGATVNDGNYIAIKEFFDYVKKYDSGIITVVGGPSATFSSVTILQEINAIDIVVQGEGEHTILDLMRYLDKKQQLGKINGIAYRTGFRKINVTPRRPLVGANNPHENTLDEFPSPYLSNVFDMKKYSAAYVSSTRGCCFRCIFCICASFWGRVVRYHSIKRVLDEIDYLYNKGITQIDFTDDTFTLNRARVKELCKCIIKRKYIDLNISLNTRVDCVDPELLYMLKRSGVRRITLGLDGGNEDTLEFIRKGYTLERAKNNIRLIKQNGIEVGVSFIIGFPCDTFERVKKAFGFLQSLGADFYQLHPLEVLPGSLLYKKHKEYGMKLKRKGLKFEVMKTPHLDKEKINLLIKNGISILQNSYYSGMRDMSKTIYIKNFVGGDSDNLICKEFLRKNISAWR